MKSLAVKSNCSVSQFKSEKKYIVHSHQSGRSWCWQRLITTSNTRKGKGLGTYAVLLEISCLSIGIMACIVHVLVGRMCFSLPLLCFCSAVMSHHDLSPFPPDCYNTMSLLFTCVSAPVELPSFLLVIEIIIMFRHLVRMIKSAVLFKRRCLAECLRSRIISLGKS